MRGSRGRALIALAIGLAGALCAAPTASAATLFADPAGSASGTCEPPDPPCTLQRAVEVEAVNGDEVVVGPGDYNEGANALTVATAIDLHGAASQPTPRILSTATTAAVDVSSAGALVRNLRIDHSVGSGAALDILAASTAERVIATSSSNVACVPGFGALIRDSICQSTAAGEAAVRLFTSGGPSIAILRNVTAVASVGNSNAIDLQVFDVGDQTLNGTNVIASGNGTAADVSAINNAAGTVTINLDHSNYDTENEPGPNTAITDPGSGTNQLALPQFVNATVGDFHQLTGSPTIDAGAADALLGPLDIDGEARNQGPAPDIGADEFTVPAPPPPGDTFPPDTKITDGPKKKTKKRNVKFEFGGSEPGVTFECQLDDNGFEPCTSPQKLRGLKRSAHVYAVRAVDAAGNADPTPADRRWRIKKRPGRR